MAIEAPLSSYKKKNYLIIALLLLGGAAIFGYDGYLSKYEWSMRHDFYKEHVIDNGGVPDGDMMFNQKAPPLLAIAGIGVVIYYLVIVKKKRVIAEDTNLVAGGISIAYDAIEKLNKTHFDKKGFFVITYSQDGQNKELKLSDRTYDNLPAVLDHIVSKIS
ncbi:MAG: hypothetical protein ABFR90_02135 [Planctomycetota bacterium]